MSDNVRIVDARVRMALRGTETIRGIVVSTPVARVVSVQVAGGVLPAIVPSGVTVVVGSVVELERPRGLTGQLHVVRVLG